MRRLPVRGPLAAVCVTTLCLWALATGCGRDPLVYGNLGDACFDDEQCQGDLRCLEGRCEIIDGVLPDGGFPDLDPPDFDPDFDPDLGPDLPQRCRPGQTACLDEQTVGVCDPEGQGFEAVERCGRGFCDGGSCIEVPPECRDGELRCDGSFTVTRCVNGRFQDWEMCPRSAPCRQGACVPLNNELADVAVQRVSFRPQEVLSGQAITVDLRVANLGRADAAPLSCEIFATANNPRPDRDFFLGSAPIEFLAAGEEFSGAVRATVSAPPGRYRVYAACDRDNFIPESNEDNNLRIADLALTVRDDGQPRPDLIWSELFIERDGVQEGESAPIYGVICNQGDGDAFEVGVEVIVESASGRGERVSLGEQFFGGVPAGACLDFRFDSNPIPCPSDREPLWLVTGLVDPFNLIEESAEDNNLINNQQVLFVECGPDDCQGDRFDPADVNAPPLISPGRYDLALCSGDVDAFRLDLQAGDIARGLIQINEPLPIYAQLLAEGAPEPLLVGVEVFDAVEFQTEPVPASGRYLLLIEPLSPESVTYTFEYEIERGAALPDLVVSDLSVGLVVDPNGRQLFSYTFNVTNRGRAVAASVVTTVQLADPLGEVVDGSDNNTNQMLPGQSQRFAGRALVPLMPSAGVYTLIVTADATNRLRESDEANNTLRAQRELGGQPQGCADALDPNDTMEQPAEIDEGQYEGLQICAQDNNDYYLLCPPMGATAMNITVNFQHSRGDIDMTLFNEERRRVAQANGVRDTEQILYTDLRGGCYTLRVYLFGNGAGSNDYTMFIGFEGGDVEPVCEDEAEPNNNFLNSPRLEDLPNELPLAFCPASDVDFFQIQLTEGQLFSVGALPTEMIPGEISLTLYGPDLNFITQIFEPNPTLDYEATQPGLHYLRAATSAEVDSYPYVLEWFVAP